MYLPSDEKARKFSLLLKSKIQQKFLIVERNDKLPFAVLTKEKTPVNHKLNFFICCATLGIWSPVWLYLSKVASRSKQIIVALDEDGNPYEVNCYSRG